MTTVKYSVRVRQRINPEYIILSFTAVWFTWLLHEFGHWLMGTLLGNNMAMTINSGYALDGYQELRHQLLIDAAGPVVTIIQAFAFVLIIKRTHKIKLFPFVATCLYMRLLAGAMNVINLNDEGRISHTLNIGTYTLSLLVCLVLFYPVYKICKDYNLKPKFIAFTILLIMVWSAVLILSDQAFELRVL